MIKSKKNNKVLRLSLFVILIIVVLVFIFTTGKEKRQYPDNTKILSTITQVLDINTVKYTYSNIVSITKDKIIKDIKIPFMEQSFIIKYEGVINGGIKSEDIKIIENDGDKIIIEISNCGILEHYIDDTKLYVYDVKNSIFNKLDTNELLSDVSKYKVEYEDKLIEEGFLDEIKENTKVSLENTLKNVGYNNIEIRFN